MPMQPAEDAGDPKCAEVTVRLPETVGDGLQRRDTNAQATGAWGNPASVLLRCGVPTPPPTTDRCISINGIDWVEDSSQAPRFVYTTYGRTPAAEVIIDTTAASGAALVDLSEIMSYLPKTGGCVGAIDFAPTATDAPAPAPSAPAASPAP